MKAELTRLDLERILSRAQIILSQIDPNGNRLDGKIMYWCVEISGNLIKACWDKHAQDGIPKNTQRNNAAMTLFLESPDGDGVEIPHISVLVVSVVNTEESIVYLDYIFHPAFTGLDEDYKVSYTEEIPSNPFKKIMLTTRQEWPKVNT